MPYSVRQLARLAGITPRALRHYDALGLLSPARRESNNYRRYDEAEALRLQQILFFRELDFPLADIKKMLSHPGFNVLESLHDQKRLLYVKRARLNKLIKTIETTIDHMIHDTPADDDALYGGFSREEYEKYQAEAKEKWGQTEAWRQSQERTKTWTKENYKKIKEENDAAMRELVAVMRAGKAPESAEAQAVIARHRAGINRFYDCTDAIYAGLAEMYLADQRFADHYRAYDPELPAYLVAGMRASLKK